MSRPAVESARSVRFLDFVAGAARADPAMPMSAGGRPALSAWGLLGHMGSFVGCMPVVRQGTSEREERIAESLARRTFAHAGPRLGAAVEVLRAMGGDEAKAFLSARARRLLRVRLDEVLAEEAWPKSLEDGILRVACRRLVEMAIAEDEPALAGSAGGPLLRAA